MNLQEKQVHFQVKGNIQSRAGNKTERILTIKKPTNVNPEVLMQVISTLTRTYVLYHRNQL
jgi:hypothetical protein